MTPLDIEAAEGPTTLSGYYSRSDLVLLSDDYVRKHQQKLATSSAKRLMDQILEKRQVVYEREYVSRTGTRIPVEVSAQCFELAGQMVVMCAARDITERQRAEQELRNTERRFEDFFAYSPIGIAIYDADRKPTTVNPACLKMLGIPNWEEFERLNLFESPLVPEPVRKKLLAGETVRFELALDFKDVLSRALFVTTRSGDAFLDVPVNNMSMDSRFRPQGYFAQFLDITEQRRAEAGLRASEQHLRQAEKMEAIGSMAGGIAHDFNNILTPIIGYANMLICGFEPTDTRHNYAAGIDKAAKRAKSLVAQILTFSRRSDEKEEAQALAIHLIPIVKEVLQLQRQSLPPEVEINRAIKTERDVVVANPTQMHELFMNLCANAGYAMRATKGGALDVRVTDFVLEPRARSQYPDLEPGRYLRVSVRDTGTGMDKATIGRIFEPFFTTKPKGEGTGMGLAMVHGILKRSKGAITVESEPGKGSTFHAILPLVEAEATVEREADTDEPLPGGNERILIVDDDADSLELEKEMLQSLGYQVLAFASSEEALRQIRENPGLADLVLSDLAMPRLSGLQLTHEILAARPDLPVLICAGISSPSAEEDSRRVGARAFMRKPPDIRQIATVIRRELDRSRQAAGQPAA
ncbi:MAG: response regulator [Verrucomicrobiota bacterium]|nr:response regulator [Verrucomicrobiota bacterium]